MSYYDTAEGKRVLELENQITTLSANIYAAEYQWLCLLAQFDELEGWCGKGIKSFAHWLNWKCGISLVAGREKVRVARKLPELPLISKAMSEGRLSYSKLRAITRIATAQNEQDLLYIAQNGTAEHLEKTVRLYRQAKDAVDSDVDSNQANQQHETKYLTYYYDIDGSLVINGRMPAGISDSMRTESLCSRRAENAECSADGAVVVEQAKTAAHNNSKRRTSRNQGSPLCLPAEFRCAVCIVYPSSRNRR
jgi:hypothetical protein